MEENTKRGLIIAAILSLIAGYFCMRFGILVCCKYDIIQGFYFATSVYADDLIVNFPAPSTFNLGGLIGFLVGFGSVWMIWAWRHFQRKNHREGQEHGSQRWATMQETLALKNLKSEDDNMIFTQNAGLATRRDYFDQKHDRNLNVCVVGGSGTGKTRYYVKPNLMQLNGNYFVTDPKGSTLPDTGHLFIEHGYDVRSFNTIEFDKSSAYNPLAYVKTDADILSFVNCLIKNTNNGKNDSGGDPFWEKSESLLYMALLGFLRDWFPPSQFTLPNLVWLLSKAEARDDDENFKSDLDLFFEQIETGYTPEIISKKTVTNSKNNPRIRKVGNVDESGEDEYKPTPLYNRRTGIYPGDPKRNKNNKIFGDKYANRYGVDPEDDFALSNYKAFKTAAGKTLKSIIISCNVRLKPLEIPEIKNILEGAKDHCGNATGKCELELDKLGDPDVKRAIFAITSDTDRTFDFLLAILMWQAMNVLCLRALDFPGEKLPRMVNFVMDEFANIGTLPDFDSIIAVTRSRNIALTLILQSFSQLKKNYNEESAKTIKGNCDSIVFLGGGDNEVNKEISEMLGKETITSTTYNQSKGKNGSSSSNQQLLGRDLLDSAEVGMVERTHALVLVKNYHPILDPKFDLESHKRYAYIDPGHKGAYYQDRFDIRNQNKEKELSPEELRMQLMMNGGL